MLEEKIITFGGEKFHILQKHPRKTNPHMKNKPYGLGGKKNPSKISHKPTHNPFKIPMLRVEQGAVKQTGGGW